MGRNFRRGAEHWSRAYHYPLTRLSLASVADDPIASGAFIKRLPKRSNIDTFQV